MGATLTAGPMPGAHAGKIGPNAITRVAQALPPRLGSARTRDLFEHAGLLHHLQQPPQQMVDEEDVRRLHRALRLELGESQSRDVAREAGLATADYLLARRIPRPVQAVLRHLPAVLAARVLLAAIRRNAWTFVGTGHFEARPGGWSWRGAAQPVVLSIRNNPLCKGVASAAPACDYYAATFERLFQVLVHPRSTVLETACEACGDDECRFEIRWRGSLRARRPAPPGPMPPTAAAVPAR
jgi:divinyl protochlorophyllide a 8-vinyl-reductase